MGVPAAAAGVDAIRLRSERRGMEALLGDPAVKRACDAARAGLAGDLQRRRLLSEALRVTDKLMPEFAALLKKAQALAGPAGRVVEAFVHDDAKLNAACMDAGDGRVYLLFTSRIVERMTPGELLFVAGHELGHAAFRHHDLPATALLRGAKGLTQAQALALMSWSRRAELSCDRVGFLCCRSLSDAASALLKLTCGLGEPHVKLDLEALKTQMADITSLTAGVEASEDWLSTHPYSPLRAAALAEFAAAPGAESSEARVESLLSAMEPPSPEATSAAAAEVLLWGGLWLARCSGGESAAEAEAVAGLAGAERLAKARAEL
ncbi:MAG: M48 family metallopeptidase, partial [Elusimicrobiota bacterium]|nr:M48 family metallopeptidase [Elusimicrobiota bacterium]